jgi:hypothetical protein
MARLKDISNNDHSSLPKKDTSKKEKLSISDFSFEQSREKLKNLKGNLSNAVIEERRSYL